MKRLELEAKFISDMITAFPDTADNVVTDLKSFAKKLGTYSMPELVQGIKEKHRYNRIKSIGVIYGYAKELGINVGSQEKAFFYCGNCKVKFSSDSRGCPVCGNFIDDIDYKTGIATGDEVREVIPVREECWECRHYNVDNPNCEGPTCGGWGKGHQGGLKCSKCVCAKCCNEKYLFKKEFQRFQEIDEAGELEDRRMKVKQRA